MILQYAKLDENAYQDSYLVLKVERYQRLIELDGKVRDCEGGVEITIVLEKANYERVKVRVPDVALFAKLQHSLSVNKRVKFENLKISFVQKEGKVIAKGYASSAILEEK